MISQNPETKFNSYLNIRKYKVLPSSLELHDTGCKERKLCNIKTKMISKNLNRNENKKGIKRYNIKIKMISQKTN